MLLQIELTSREAIRIGTTSRGHLMRQPSRLDLTPQPSFPENGGFRQVQRAESCVTRFTLETKDEQKKQRLAYLAGDLSHRGFIKMDLTLPKTFWDHRLEGLWLDAAKERNLSLPTADTRVPVSASSYGNS